MEYSMDPYEQQLLSVFNSYDISHCGRLDRDGLVQLCNSLQLEEQGIELIKGLLSDSKSHVTFNEFKDGLLALLGNVQNNRQKLDRGNSSDSESESPDREISPKFVYGSKKYGRRSRPESTEQIEVFEEKHSDMFLDKFENKSLKNINKVQRSNSQSDVTHSRKRKTSGKLKRCTSFPGNHEMEKQFTKWNQEKLKDNTVLMKLESPSLEYNEHTLKLVLEQLDVGKDGFLNQFELVRVCEYIGMHKLTKSILQQMQNKQDTEVNKRISVEEFVSAMQKDDCFFDVSAPVHTLNNSCITEDSMLFPNNKTLQHITFGPNGSGMISSQTIIELWENIGIISASSLLLELGFTDNTIAIVDLASILEDELRNLNDSRTDISYSNINPHIVLLQASIALYQSEVKYLKSVLEQLSAERDKLKTDITDANHRASLLAQEIDDNHAKIEKTTQNQIRLLEQKHSEILKELSAQFSGEKEHMSVLNSQLEQKLAALEMEESKLRSDLLGLQKYNVSLEKENHSLTTRLTELELQRASLNEKVELLESECQRITDMERERDQLEPILEKLSLLQIENAELRDKNDELCTEVESLNSQMSAMHAKISSTPTFNVSSQSGYGEENVSAICEGVGLGAIKRRVDSPKENESNMETESPRLGKVRKCFNKNQTGEVLLEVLGQQMPLNSSESGFEAELECLDSSLSFTGSEGCSNDEVSQLQARISWLEQLLLQNSIKLPPNHTNISKNVADGSNEHIKDDLVKRCKELESLLTEVQSTFTKIMDDNFECKEKRDLLNPISLLSDKLKGIMLEKDNSADSWSSVSTTLANNDVQIAKTDIATETDSMYLDKKTALDEKIKENCELKERCEDLEQALEMLRFEYENCENYWANKLDEERQMFETEQKQSSEKLTELLSKMSEYEEQFTTQDNNGRLSPIEEKGCLEQQFTELEEEYEDFKLKMETNLEMKNREIEELQVKLTSLESQKCDMSIQADLTSKTNLVESKISHLSNVIQSTNIFSSETLPNSWQYPPVVNSQLQLDSIESSTSINNLSVSECNYINPANIWSRSESGNTTESTTSSLAENGTSNVKADHHSCSSLPPNIFWQPATVNQSPQPHSLTHIPDNSDTKLSQTNPCRAKRPRKNDKVITNSQLRAQKKDLVGKTTGNENCMNSQNRWNGHENEQTCVLPVSSIRNLHRRLRELDQHCKNLQVVLKQQQKHSESLMHHCWQQHRDEVIELQEKLTKADKLIKELYVENTYLMANNQHLEHRCHILVQCNSESTSV